MQLPPRAACRHPRASMRWIGSLGALLIAIAVAFWLRAHPSSLLDMAATTTPTRQWADAPIPMVKTPMFETKKDDTFTKGATHMALLHNAVLRGFNTIILQTPHVKPEDYAAFIGYTLTWCKFVVTHHDSEEAELFPQTLEVLGKTDEEIWGDTHHEHEALVPTIAALKEYLDSLAATPADLSKEKVLELVRAIQQPLHTHFHSEIATIAGLAQYGSFPAADASFKAWGKKSLTSAGYTDVAPFLLTNIDRTYEEGMWENWPPMPGPIRWGIVQTGNWMHPGWFKFASCDLNGYPKDLYALGEQEEKA